MLKIKQNIPNAITSGNLLCGCLAIVKAFEGDLVWAAYLVGIAAVLDFFDGFFARLLKVSSPIGKDLDSLADMVTFGVVPGVIIYCMILKGLDISKEGFDFIDQHKWVAFTSFIITIFSAIRLAKFNHDTRQADSFIGVPTPANAMVICSLPLIVEFHRDPYGKFYTFLFNPYLLLGIVLVMSFLLVTELPLFALKFKNFGWTDNKIRYIFLTTALILLVCFQFVGIPIIILLYILFSVVNNIAAKRKNV